MKIIDGRKLSENILEEVRAGVKTLPFQPVFSDVLVGKDNVSRKYMEMKARMAESLGIKFQYAQFPEDIQTQELIIELQKLNKLPHMAGIIVQLPLPKGLDRELVLDAISPELDADCLGSVRSAEFYRGESKVSPPTALACMHILDSLELNLKEKKIAVLGQGNLVGKPVAALLHSRGLEPVVISMRTKNQTELLRESDVIVSGIGKARYITRDMIKLGAILIDAGTSESGASIVGDVDLESVSEVAGHVSPVPGGVGPVTIAMLFKNVLSVAKSLAGENK